MTTEPQADIVERLPYPKTLEGAAALRALAKEPTP